MEKKAVVRAGLTPSELSGEKSASVKNGVALAKGEKAPSKKIEAELAKNMSDLYNRHGTT